MTNSFSSSKLPVSQEIENLSSFNFSIPPPEESLSIPVYVVGEIGESNTPHTEVVASPALQSGEILPCFPTLVLSGEKSQNFEAQSVVKPNVEPSTEEVKAASRAMSSAMSEQLFEGDLPEGKGPESNISLRGDVQPTLLEQELRSPEQVPHSTQPMFDQTSKSFDVDSEEKKEGETPLVLRRKGFRGANASIIVVPDLGGVDAIPETKLDNEPTESEQERKRKGKGKMVESHTKWDKKKYATRGEMQKMMRSAITANEIQMEKNKKRRWDGHMPEEPTSTPLHVGSGETESDDIAIAVAKKRK
ncbi:hypothetical protein KY284_013241 [Solanum tuberosum]|nr:hypothetical protein KY284_013241 [Solanum tuberosum]